MYGWECRCSLHIVHMGIQDPALSQASELCRILCTDLVQSRILVYPSGIRSPRMNIAPLRYSRDHGRSGDWTVFAVAPTCQSLSLNLVAILSLSVTVENVLEDWKICPWSHVPLTSILDPQILQMAVTIRLLSGRPSRSNSQRQNKIWRRCAKCACYLRGTQTVTGVLLW